MLNRGLTTYLITLIFKPAGSQTFKRFRLNLSWNYHLMTILWKSWITNLDCFMRIIMVLVFNSYLSTKAISKLNGPPCIMRASLAIFSKMKIRVVSKIPSFKNDSILMNSHVLRLFINFYNVLMNISIRNSSFLIFN